jgi:ABC-type glycerol-3-phosphate transport system substrate-binding protein
MSVYSPRQERYRALALSVAFAAVLGACAAPQARPAAAPAVSDVQTDDKAPITVWIDDTRKPTVEAFKKKYPDKAALIKEEVVDRSTLPAKVLLFNNTGKGWPDVVFAEPDLVAKVADASRDYPLNLADVVPKDIQNNFAPGALAPCTFGGKLFCLRNDLAQNLLYYNKPLMKQFGYEVPKTWAKFEELGQQLAKEHPGYILGAIDESTLAHHYLWASRCPLGQAIDANTIYINVQDEKCLRAVKMVDNLLKLGVLAKVGPFDPAVAKIATENKLLLIIGPSWFGEYVFGGKPDSTYYKTAEGQLALAPPPQWEGEDKAYTGFWGGSAWTVSKHTRNPKLAVEFAIFASTATEYHGTGPTYPAYAPAAKEWRKTVQGNKLYAEDPYPVMEQAAALVDPLIVSLRYDDLAPFKAVTIPAITKGETIESTLPEVQKQLVAAAEAQGYTVVTKK